MKLKLLLWRLRIPELLAWCRKGWALLNLFVLMSIIQPAWSSIIIDPPQGLANSVSISRDSLKLLIVPGWNSLTVKTRGGKQIALIDLVFGNLTPEGSPTITWYADNAWANAKWVAVEQNKERDVLYGERSYQGWLSQVWIAMYAGEESAFIRQRTTLLRGPQTLINARRVMALSHKEGPFDKGGVTVIIDDKVNPLPQCAVDQYIMFKSEGFSVAAVNPGEQFQKRGQIQHFADFVYNPAARYMEVSFQQAQSNMPANDYLETTLVLLWGDGDITGRVRDVQANADKALRQFPSPIRPLASENEKNIRVLRKGLPDSLIRALFSTPQAANNRVYPAGEPAQAAPVIDGMLEDLVWSNSWADQFIIYNTSGILSDLKSSFQVRYDARALYLAMRNPHPFLDKVRKARLKPDKYTNGEKVELFFLAGASGKSIYQICIDPQGGVYRSVDENNRVDLKLKAAARQEAAGWNMEIEIPFETLGLPAPRPFQTLRFNVVRGAAQTNSPTEISSWNPSKGSLAGRDNFGAVFFGTDEQYRKEQNFYMEAILDRDNYDPCDCAAGLFLKIIAASGIPEGLKLIAEIVDKAGNALRASETPVTGPVGDLVLNLQNCAEGEYQVRLGLAMAGKEIARTAVPFQIKSTDRKIAGRGKIPFSVQSAYSAARLPVSMGVPFPKGELNDPVQVRIRDVSGNEVIGSASRLAAWDPRGSIAWLRLDFQTPVIAEKPVPLVLEYGLETGAPKSNNPQASSIAVNENDDQFIVNTGPLRLLVPRKQGSVLQAIWLDLNGDGQFTDLEQIVKGAELIGPYLVDGAGKIYIAAQDKSPAVILEEKNPQKAVFRIESWYVNRDGAKLCRHVTRLSAYAGLAHLRLEHTWIMTASTGEAVFKDIGFAVPSPQSERVAFGTEKGVFNDYSVHPRYLLQDHHLHYSIQGEHARLLLPVEEKERYKKQSDIFTEGARAPGWMAIKGDRAGMVLAVDEFWQNFPKELGLDKGVATLHVWPKHGISHNRPVSERSLTHLDFVHEGNALDFKPPKEVEDYQTANPNDQKFIQAAAQANAMGISKTHRFALTFFPSSNLISEVVPETCAVADTPAVKIDPEWMTRSGAFGPLYKYDPENYPDVERSLSNMADLVIRLLDLTGCYGMWCYGQLLTEYNHEEHRWNLYRILNQLHHNGPLWPWSMWARSGNRDYFDFALANTRILADTAFCHYSRPDVEKLPWPLGKLKGGLTDYKGLVPWNGGNRNPDYNSLTSFLLLHYYMTGDAWTREVALEWGALAKKQGPTGGGTRLGSGTIRAALDLYQATWDTGFIPIYRETAQNMFKTQMPSGCYPGWISYTPWLGEFYRFTGSATARQSLLHWADAFMEGCGDLASTGSGWGTYMDIPATAYFVSGEIKYARAARGLLEYWIAGMYADPESYLRGGYPGKYFQSSSFTGHILTRGPIALAAWAQAGKSIAPIYPSPFLPALVQTDGNRQLEILALDQNDSTINIDLTGIISRSKPDNGYKIKFCVFAPDAKQALVSTQLVVHQDVIRFNDGSGGIEENYPLPAKWLKWSIPPDGQKGIYTVLVSSTDTDFSLRVPVSEQKEIYRLAEPGKFYMHERMGLASFWMPTGIRDPKVRFTINSLTPATIKVLDPDFKQAAQVHLLGLYGQSASRVLTLPHTAGGNPGGWTLFGGIAPPVNIEFIGAWRPAWFSVWPDRTFEPGPVKK